MADCVWYDECNSENGKIQNCLAKDTKPKPFRNENKSMEILQEKCFHFLKKHKGNEFCCSDNQLDTMLESMSHASNIFGRCPTCMINLNQHICHMTCSPDQHKFMQVVKTYTNKEGKEYITEINFYIEEEYEQKTFDSCKEIIVPSTGGKAIDISCGIVSPTNPCTPDKWFKFFGDFNENIVAPFDINYVTTPSNGYETLNIHDDVLPCNESYESSKACSCNDCESSCTVPFVYSEPPAPFLIGNMDGILFILNVTFGILGVATFVLLIRFHYFTKHEEEFRNSHLGEEDKTTDDDGDKLKKNLGDKLKENLEKFFTKWGIGCSKRPVVILFASSWIVVGLCHGALNLKITTEPTEIWASPDSPTRLDKNYFDTRFAPFYRTNQIFIKTKGLKNFKWISPFDDNFTVEFGPAFNFQFLEQVYKLQMNVQNLASDKDYNLKNICFAPVKNEFFNEDTVDYCTVQSVWGYLQNDIERYRNDTDALYNKLQKCLRNNFDPDCLAPFGGPIFSPLAVGGHRDKKNQSREDVPDNYLLATGLSLTFLLNNGNHLTTSSKALKWEKTFIEYLKEWKINNKPKFMEIAFSAERSIQDEIERESHAEMLTVIISYLVMFLYITISLGKLTKFSSLLLETKFTLGLGGILIVLTSVLSSLGIFSYLGVSTTLLTIEVIPFLILAVGVDNIFILVHTYQKCKSYGKNATVEQDIGKALGKVGPSILLSSLSEAACFSIGTLSNMPAIKTFAQYSSVAIILNFLLQITCFVSILSLDSKRERKNYADVFCCIKVKKSNNSNNNKKSDSILYYITKNYYVPFLMKSWVRIFVVMMFLTFLYGSIYFTTQIEKGLDQELSMPEDSYVIDYFKFMKDLLSVGPPVYFVIQNDINFTSTKEVNAICGTVGCDSDSFVTYLSKASKHSNVSYLAKSPSSWIDDYFDWLSNSNSCCKEFKVNSSFCPHQREEGCQSCQIHLVDWRPTKNDFKKYLPYFLNDNPDVNCVKGGHPLYSTGVNFEYDTTGELVVKDNYFMSYHTSLKTSKDFYMALENSKNIARHLSEILTGKLNRTIQVFPYSIFYVFYEQYLNIVEDALVSLGLSLLAIFSVTFLFTGFDLKSSLLLCLTVSSILVSMTGMLHWWNITLNAISLVNLLVSVGIGVEFCSHILHAFKTSREKTRILKASDAVTVMGTSVFSGITLTKFLGIIVLAFAQTLMLRTFYFKMYLGIVLIGAIHGLILLPVLLSYVG
ncbi:Niemann-Pick C1 protein precursor, putative [Pediculus humanus corporis]|uniref:Niemann-Pick C1 protein, putative n=1 Tax=Pediculus humanus subsp. corporis TaxID=121224 RepID=E0W1Y7_PEDHC|nr:Niemann-Pick C1 protein precursor, putative [Pediculus humanus corporis]EEB19581.1 Niemann-Pick C1 protein precursor, putative [Pediculus humanus corporis]